MKAIKKILPVAMATALTAGLTTQVQAATEHNGPDFFGKLNVGVLSAGSRDVDVFTMKADVGFKGLYSTDSGVKFKYEVVADLAGEMNGADSTGTTWTSGENTTLDEGSSSASDIDIHTARVFIITKAGLFLVGPRTMSGQWYQLYSNVDKFEYNRMHTQTGVNAMFTQAEQGDDVLAYVSPELTKGLRFIAAGLTIADANGEDLDATAWRFVYKKGAFNAGFGNVNVSDKLAPAEINRTALTAGYDFGKFSIGATYENTDMDMDNANNVSMAVVGELDMTDAVTATLGYVNKDHDNDANDNTAILAKLAYQFDKNIKVYAEGGQYDETPNNLMAGVSVSF